ncbi:FAD/NAD(P)-binding oxidoreductase family protein [Striga asiatica]|uniref:FAD/NAD(P)-binding oxidoreductase family protein n=1 Tax=Striga asiatica TaxID=4170 RepID=A0A5A7PQ37_STRAF|nr:FAD/NAD(P)-binding oxidoreductase family protein [Striga asiatica]
MLCQASTMAALVTIPQKWPPTLGPPQIGVRRRPICTASMAGAEPDVRKEDIVIVGAGVAGLATAVALQRKKKGWNRVVGAGASRVAKDWGNFAYLLQEWMESFGCYWGREPAEEPIPRNSRKLTVDDSVDQLTNKPNSRNGGNWIVVRSASGRKLRSFNFEDEDPSQEVRAVERRILLETLASQLPPNAISFSSNLKNIETSENGETILRLEDESQISSKIVIACDGIRSPVAKWMGFPDARYVGYCALRGLGYYPNGQPFEPRVTYIYGRGVRTKITDPSILRQETETLVKDWPTELLDVIRSSPDDTIIRTPLVDRWLWPGVSPPSSKGKVVLVGDAWHPMTPNLGQGACCALEDAIVLTGLLAEAVKTGTFNVEDAFRSYGEQRWPRIFPLTARANLVGALLQLENSVVCSLRDNVLVPKLVKLGSMLEHTKFDFEPLQFDKTN